MSDLQQHPLYSWQGAHGFLRHWFICGFFPAHVRHGEPPCLYDRKDSENWQTDYLTPWGGEAGITDVPAVTGNTAVEWLPIQGDEFEQTLNLTEARYNNPALAAALVDVDPIDSQWYALAILESDKEQVVTLKFSVHDGTRLFHNGALIYDQHRWHGVIYDEESLQLTLRPGRNSLLFKNERQAMVARVVDADDHTPAGLLQLGGDDAPQRVANAAYSLRKHAASLSIAQPFNGSNADELRQWQEQFRVVYNKGMGASPPTKAIKNKVKEIERVSGDGYTRHQVQISCEGDCVFDACVLIPDDERRNGRTILTPHGHRFLYHHVTGVEAEPQPRWSQMGPHDANYNEQLAQAGFVTAAFSQRGFDNRCDVADHHPCNTIARMAEAMGYRLPRLYIEDINRLADYVATFDGVDGNKLGIAGLSGGATMSWITAAYDARFTAAATFCGLMRARHWVNNGACGMQIVPDIFPHGDTGEILSLIAPRALLIGQGRLDASFNIIENKSIYEDAHKAWRAAGVEDKIEYIVIESGHQFHVPSAVRFFEKHL